ncbi:ribosomal RNA small subunit methyltransferase A [Elusimicrobiota bacterium]
MTNRALHQHDLTAEAARSMVATAGIRKTDTVLEAGAGTGQLTAALLASGAEVHAVELDRDRLKRLEERFKKDISDGRLTLHAGDATRVAPRLRQGWRVVANPPFNLTAALIRRWLTSELPGGPPGALDLVLQFQAAKKLTPVPGAMTRSSVMSALFGAAKLTKKLRRDDVVPPSHVPLSGWSLRRAQDAPGAAELAEVDRVLQHGFSGPRTMREVMRKLLTVPQMKRQAADHGWRLEHHPRTLAPEAWLAIASFLGRSGGA